MQAPLVQPPATRYNIQKTKEMRGIYLGQANYDRLDAEGHVAAVQLGESLEWARSGVTPRRERMGLGQTLMLGGFGGIWRWLSYDKRRITDK